MNYKMCERTATCGACQSTSRACQGFEFACGTEIFRSKQDFSKYCMSNMTLLDIQS